jgi:nitrite reductase/ring-hydroxylating ferredoxin subunit
MSRFPFPIPNGWFALLEESELTPGAVRSLHCFGRELVAFRSAVGGISVLDAHCPHLGAHLGGGRVVEGSLRCPFHGWRFGGDGRCVEVPYGSGRIPRLAQVRSYPVAQAAGLVFAWHHLEGAPPAFEFPEIPEFEDPGFEIVRRWDRVVATCCQEMAENNADWAHFPYVHGAPQIPVTETQVQGAQRRFRSPVQRTLPDGRPLEYTLDRESHGLGLGVVRVGPFMTFLSSTAPIDEDHVHVRWVFAAPRALAAQAREMAEGFVNGVQQDIPIWENKVYRSRPVLADGDGPIAQHREWARQFYSWPPTAPEAGGGDRDA